MKNTLPYTATLKENARQLRNNQTDSEQALWTRIRKKHIRDIQFYRQKPIGHYIVDFFAPKINLVVEIDGSQHQEQEQAKKDRQRDSYLKSRGLKILRFNSRETLLETDAVAEEIFRMVECRLLGLSESDKSP
jgi:very-short-patch-repair endonuclease